jgi:KaiC/GvpD/RAD55 family RecA-like ATPase
LVSTGVPSLDNLLGRDGYPDKSAILVVGPPGIGKEALGYWFVCSGLVQGDYCVYVTHRPVTDALRDMKGSGISTERVPEWIASAGSPVKCDLRDATSISFNTKEAVHRNIQRRVRVATDVLSPLLVLNPLESMYNYWSQLVSEIDEILRNLNVTEPDTSFLYHLLRLQLLFKLKVKDKKLAEEMLNEIYLSSHDLQREFHEMRAILEHQ